MELTYFSLAILGGLGFLVWSADKFVASAVSIARSLRVSPMVIGLTVVAFGTSAPEMLVSATAALEGARGLSVGNAIGSNIANIGLVLGLTALISPLPIKPLVLKRELPLLLVMSTLAYLIIQDNAISLADGLALLGLMVISLFVLTRKGPEAPELLEEVDELDTYNARSATLWFIGSLALLIASSKLLVWGATGLAEWAGVSDLVIGLTIVAIGTSLPELAASVASALKGHHDIALGNVIGSNLFNLLTVLPMPGLLNPGLIEGGSILRDYFVMMGMTVTLALFCYLMKKRGIMSRFEGALLLAGYGGYLMYIGNTL